MGKVYIGVTAVGGHKLWGGGWKEGCGIRWFGGMGERWKIDGRRWEGCGPGMPGTYGVAQKRRLGQASTSGKSPSHPIFTQALHVSP